MHSDIARNKANGLLKTYWSLHDRAEAVSGEYHTERRVIVKELYRLGYSYVEIGELLHLTRQRAQQLGSV
jgi:DNA-binding NarL/FixJ family response regulator